MRILTFLLFPIKTCYCRFVPALGLLLLFGLAGIDLGAAPPNIAITNPTNGQQIATFPIVAGYARANTGVLQQVVFSIYNQSSGLWWNGAGYQGSPIDLPVSLSGTNWTRAAGVGLPLPCCGQLYQVAATATDSSNNVASTNIVVQGDSIPPVVTITPFADGQTVNSLSGLGGSVSDNFGLVTSVGFSLHEVDINGGPGRFWNGTNFQSPEFAFSAAISGSTWSPKSGFVFPTLNSGQPYLLSATATDTNSNTGSTNLTVWAPITELAWDPGLSPTGTVIFANPNTNGGNYWFKIVPQNPVVGVWRNALRVTVGEADLYLRQDAPPNVYNHSHRSARVGSDGFVLHASEFDPSQNWFLLVTASSSQARWTLVTGDAYVHPLGQLAANGASGTNVTIQPEGMAFFKTTVPSDTLAWRLWLNGGTNAIFIKKSAAPHPISHELVQDRQMLVVPPYLAADTFNGYYFVGIPGDPGAALNLDSRKHAVTDISFNSVIPVAVPLNDFPYRSFRVQVPVSPNSSSRPRAGTKRQ